MTPVVQVRIVDGVALVVLNNPPVNALSLPVRQALASAIKRLEAAEEVAAIVLIGHGRTFPPGIDLRELDESAASPDLGDICAQVEACAKPVVAAVHGTCMGGGLELALATHYRLAHPSTRFGFPEISIDLPPGAGGTQRAPRLIGADAALGLMLSGRMIDAAEAEALGLIDAIVPGDLGAAAVAAAAEAGRNGPPPRTRDLMAGGDDPVRYQSEVRARARTIHTQTGKAAAEILACVEAAQLLPFDAGLAFERAAFEACRDTDRARALRHLLLAERKAASLPVGAGAEDPDVSRVAVIGGGATGISLSTAALSAGVHVTLIERDDAALQEARDRIEDRLAKSNGARPIGAEELARRLARLDGKASMSEAGPVALAFDTTAGTAEAKSRLFAAMGMMLAENACLVAVGDWTGLEAMSRASGRPDKVCGLRLHRPLRAGSLAEVAPCRGSDSDCIAALLTFCRKIGRRPVTLHATEIAASARLLAAALEAAEATVLEGAAPEAVDAALKDARFEDVPFRMLDRLGLEAAPRRKPGTIPPLRAALLAAGRPGGAEGPGLYPAPDAAETDAAVAALIADLRQDDRPARIGADEIIARIAGAIANAGADLLAEGQVRRPSDIDVIAVFGLGFPRALGGPMHWADRLGILTLRAHLRDWAGGDPASVWAPHPLLDDLIKTGDGFADIKEG